MNWQKTHFIGAWPLWSSLPTHLPHVALLGRSNVGKSSLINLLCLSGIAKTSSTPGKTQSFVGFEVDQKLLIIDLPGYGYAKCPVSVRESWHAITEYITVQRPLCLHLIDSRHLTHNEDLELQTWLRHHSLQPLTLLTKSDKLTLKERQQAVKLHPKAQLIDRWDQQGALALRKAIITLTTRLSPNTL